MSSVDSSQKFIKRNRSPRVQIEYDVELYGSEKKISIPFVNGVLADLSGDNRAQLPMLGDRSFLDIDIDNFNDRMAAINPHVNINVADKLSGEGQMAVSLSMKTMEDFSPGAIASKIEPLQKLLQARNQLADLLTYMDGKSGAEHLIAKLLEKPIFMKALLAQDPLPLADTVND